jgi:hypothetical protein
LSRALIGAALVSLFAALGDWPRPKRFAGLFRAAPSVARDAAADWIRGHRGAFDALRRPRLPALRRARKSAADPAAVLWSWALMAFDADAGTRPWRCSSR